MTTDNDRAEPMKDRARDEFWNLIHEWADGGTEERIEWIEAELDKRLGLVEASRPAPAQEVLFEDLWKPLLLEFPDAATYNKEEVRVGWNMAVAGIKEGRHISNSPHEEAAKEGVASPVVSSRDRKPIRYVWDYVADEPVLESEMPFGSERHKLSERAHWTPPEPPKDSHE
jgi:hypothetical protein